MPMASQAAKRGAIGEDWGLGVLARGGGSRGGASIGGCLWGRHLLHGQAGR